jgi:hypothetical protein
MWTKYVDTKHGLIAKTIGEEVNFLKIPMERQPIKKRYITNLQCFIGSYKFCAKFSFDRFIQKSHEFHVVINMNKLCMYWIYYSNILDMYCFWMTYVNVCVYYIKIT